jgi:1,4-dihydroxy-2-naphthoate octaprenyltransferase
VGTQIIIRAPHPAIDKHSAAVKYRPILNVSRVDYVRIIPVFVMADNNKLLNQLLEYSRPLSLLAGLLLYALGGGIAHYLGVQIDWLVYWLGQGCITLLQVSSYFLKAFYDFPIEIRRLRRDRRIPRQDEDEAFILKNTILQIAITTLTIGAVLTVLLYTRGAINPAALIILGFAFLISFFYAVPPLQLVYSGYGELTSALFLANLTPALAFLFQTGNLHRLLAMLTFPLTALFLAATLALSMQTHAENIKRNRRTLLVRLGWQMGFQLHHFLILAAYLLLGIATLLGLPWGISWPAFLTLPIAVYQIWIIQQIAMGASPKWNVLNFTAMITFGLTTYLVAFALWTG